MHVERILVDVVAELAVASNYWAWLDAAAREQRGNCQGMMIAALAAGRVAAAGLRS